MNILVVAAVIVVLVCPLRSNKLDRIHCVNITRELIKLIAVLLNHDVSKVFALSIKF